MKKIFHYFLAFLIPVLIFLLAMYLMDLYPFGDTSMRISDANIQYPAFFEGLKDGDLFTFKIGLGANFYTIWTTYLASPLSLLYFFFENYQFDIFFVILVLLKIGLIGLNMNILLNYKRERNKYSLVFSTIYALSGFVALYYWNYQFLDALYMLPLIMIGIDKLVNDNKSIMYFITLTLMIIFHYYTAYMVCIFSVIYFFFLLINLEIEKKEKKKRIVKFFITSLFCGLASSFVIIPSIYSFIQGRANYNYDINYFGVNKDFLSFFYNLTSGSSLPIDLQNASAPVFITVFILVMFLTLFFDKNVSKKYKISVLTIFIIYLLSLSLSFMYYGWHLFNQPQGLPGRFIFCFNCFLILVAYKNFYNKFYINNKIKLLMSMCFVCIIILSFLYKIYTYNLTLTTVDNRYIILIVLNIILILYYIFLGKNQKLYLLTFFLIFLELLINLICSFNVNFALFDYETINVYVENNKVKEMNELIKKETCYFCRGDFLNNNYNNGMFYNINSISYYSSIYNQNLIEFLGKDFNKFRNFSNDGYVLMYNNNYLMNGILSIKNLYDIENQSINILNNKYYIKSLGFMIKDNNLEYEQINDDNIINFFNSLSNKKTIKLKSLYPKYYFENVKLDNNNYILIDNRQSGKVILEFIIKEDSLVDFNFDIDYFLKKNNLKKYYLNELINLYVNDKQVNNILYLNKHDNIKIVINIPSELKMISAIKELNYVNLDSYKEIMDDLNKNVIKDLTFNKLGFNGKINVNDNKNMLVLTIPYDEYLNIYIDGNESEYRKIFNGIIGLNLNDGEYEIDFKYSVKGLKLGKIISLSSIFISIIIKILEKKYIKRYNNIDNKEEIII